MRLIRDNPATAMFFTFFLSACIYAYLPLPLRILFVSISLILVLLFLIRPEGKETKNRGFLLVCCACLVSGTISLPSLLYAEHLDSLAGTETEVTLKITETDYTLAYAAGYIARITESDLIPKNTQIRLYSPLTSLQEGSILSGQIAVQSLSEGSGSFDSRAYYLPRGIMLEAEDLALVHTDTVPVFSLSSLFRQISERLSAMILANTTPEAGGLASAVLLGNRDHLDDAIERDFRRLGITHLLVVSGTHFSVLVTMADSGLKRMRLSPRLRCCISTAIILLIMMLTGLTASVVRAGIMHLMAQISMLLMRRTNLIHTFAFSGAVMILFNPYAAMDCGLQLSFAATYCCILFQIYKGSFYRIVRRKTGIMLQKLPLTGIAETVLCTCFVSLGTLPLIWLYFGEVSLFSIPANLIFTPLITMLMLITAAFLILYPLRLLILPLAFLLNGYCGFLETAAGFLASPDWLMIPVNYEFSVFFLIPMTVLLLILPFVRRSVKGIALLSAVGIGVLFFSAISIIETVDSANISFSYMPDRGNDGFVLKSQKKILLCDMSDASFGYSGILTEEMSALHGCEIDTLLLTHYHNKHIQMVNRLSEREILRNLILPEPLDERERNIYLTLLENADLHGISTVTVKPDEVFDFHGTEITLFERTYLSRSTHPVTAVKVVMGEDSLTLVSCSFNQAAPEITDALESSDYLILGGHSPVYKKTFGLSFEEEPKVMIVHENARPFMDGETASDIRSADAPFRLKVRRNG